MNIVSYTGICSSALLAVADNEQYTLTGDNEAYIDLENKETRTLLEFYIESLINDNYIFGKKNIVINTCRPANNWRKIIQKRILHPKYSIIEDSFQIDANKLEFISDNTWKKLINKLRRFILIDHPETDSLDIINIIKSHITDLTFSYPSYIILSDENNEYVHYQDIDSRINTDVEIILRKREIIL